MTTTATNEIVAPTRQLTLELPRLYPKQRRAFFNPKRFSLIEGSTKSGKSVGSMCWALAKACERPGAILWFVAPVFSQVQIMFSRLKRSMPVDFYSVNEAQKTMTLPNESVIFFKSGDNPDSLYGEDVYAAVLDEAARMKEEAYFAIRSTLTKTRGQVRFISNVRGRGNWMYALCRRAENGQLPDADYHRITWEDAVAAGVLNRDEIENARATLPDQMFKELYECIPAEDGANPFGSANIEACVAPLSSKPTAVYGIDLAKSVDWTVIIGLDYDAKVTEFHRFQRDWAYTKREILRIIGDTPTLIDDTGVGNPIVEDIQNSSAADVDGFTFTMPSKARLLGWLAAAIHAGDISYPEGDIVRELHNFTATSMASGVRYEAYPGEHDDCVMALALAYRKLTTPSSPTWVARY